MERKVYQVLADDIRRKITGHLGKFTILNHRPDSIRTQNQAIPFLQLVLDDVGLDDGTVAENEVNRGEQYLA